MDYDVIVIGAGVLGASTAMQLAEGSPRLRVAVVEKEGRAAVHQSGRNSGVIHSGIYYQPGSLKAATCVAGARALLAFCERESVPHEVIGKVIVATSEAELPALEELRRRGEANGVPGVEVIGPERLREIEPHASGVKALYSPSTAIVDFSRVTEAYLERARRADAEVIFGAKVVGFAEKPEGVELRTTAGEVTGRVVVNCAGLYADAVARMMGGGADTRVIPFRGEYFLPCAGGSGSGQGPGLSGARPERFPFLGAHFTRTIDGGVEAGPNAVLALAREGYGKASVNLGDVAGMLGYPGFLADGGAVLEDGPGGDLPVAAEGGVRPRAAGVGAGDAGGAPESRRRGGAGAGRRPSGAPRRRLPHRAYGAGRPRAERALAGGDGVAGNRAADRGAGGRTGRNRPSQRALTGPEGRGEDSPALSSARRRPASVATESAKQTVT